MSIRRLLLISCMHVGGSGALWPDDYVLAEGQTIKGSAAQGRIRQYWDSMSKREIVRSADTIVLLGDLVQGSNRKSFGQGLVTANLEDQVGAAVHLLKPVCFNGAQVLSITGSAYHDSLDTSLDAEICRRLGGKFLGGIKTLMLRGPRKTINLCHGGASPSMYKASHDDRESMLMDAAIGSGLIKHPIDIVVRGHWHYFQHIGLQHRHLVRVPGWQSWYDAKFMRDMLGKKNNMMGAVVLDVGPSTVEVRPILFDPLPAGGPVEEI